MAVNCVSIETRPFAPAMPGDARDAASDIIVTGFGGRVSINGQDMLTIKYSGIDGSVLWQNRYNGPVNSIGQWPWTPSAM